MSSQSLSRFPVEAALAPYLAKPLSEGPYACEDALMTGRLIRALDPGSPLLEQVRSSSCSGVLQVAVELAAKVDDGVPLSRGDSPVLLRWYSLVGTRFDVKDVSIVRDRAKVSPGVASSLERMSRRPKSFFTPEAWDEVQVSVSEAPLSGASLRSVLVGGNFNEPSRLLDLLTEVLPLHTEASAGKFLPVHSDVMFALSQAPYLSQEAELRVANAALVMGKEFILMDLAVNSAAGSTLKAGTMEWLFSRNLPQDLRLFRNLWVSVRASSSPALVLRFIAAFPGIDAQSVVESTVHSPGVSGECIEAVGEAIAADRQGELDGRVAAVEEVLEAIAGLSIVPSRQFLIRLTGSDITAVRDRVRQDLVRLYGPPRAQSSGS